MGSLDEKGREKSSSTNSMESTSSKIFDANPTATSMNNTNSKITCGDLVVHPTKSWPWIGTVQPKVGDFARLCSNCGGLRVPQSISKDGNTQYKIRLESEEGPVPLCESEHDDSPSIIIGEGGESTAIDQSTIHNRCYGDCCDANMIDYDDYMEAHDEFEMPPLPSGFPSPPRFPLIPPMMPVLTPIMATPNPNDVADASGGLVALSVEGGALPGRHFQVNWFPYGELSDMDGREKVIVPFKQRSLFQEGSPVARERAPTDQGLVKQVHRTVDAFVVPEYGWVVHDLPANKLKPLMDIEQCPGCFVIYKGWVGTVYNVWYRVTFRMEDGTEFVLTDDQGEISVHMREESRKTPCADINQMYPGLKMRLRWMLLENAKWPETYRLPEETREKITKSRDRWNSNDSIIDHQRQQQQGPGFLADLPLLVDMSSTPIVVKSNPAAVEVRGEGCSMIDQQSINDRSLEIDQDQGEKKKSEPTTSSSSAKKKPTKIPVEKYFAKKPDGSDPHDWADVVDMAIEESVHQMDIHLPTPIKREMAAIAMAQLVKEAGKYGAPEDESMTKEDMVAVTVVKMEPVKLDVEWLSQVINDIPAGPKGNVIEGEELKNIYIFRSSRFFEPFDLGARYRYTIESDDQIIPIEEYRRRLLLTTEDKVDTPWKLDRSMAIDEPASSRPRPGDQIYVSIARCTSSIDILWENGQFERGVDPDCLVPQYSNQTERDYFPAMYVTMQSDAIDRKHNTTTKSASSTTAHHGNNYFGHHHHHHHHHSHRGKSDSGMDDSISQATTTCNSQEKIQMLISAGNSNEKMNVDASTTISAAAPSSSSKTTSEEEETTADNTNSKSKSSFPSKFGVIKKAKNSEKYATVAWYEIPPRKSSNNNDDGGRKVDEEMVEEPKFLNEEDVSFYDLKFYYEYNYVGGTLVSRVDGSRLPAGSPNVGYVLRKNPDASVQVVWHDGHEERTAPWKLRQLTTRYDSEYSASDVDDEQHYYSPTEHEYEDLEDFRYYDYTALAMEARQKRIGLIVAVMREVILRLCKLVQTLDNHFPFADRKKVVKLTLSCNDVCNGFANLTEFRETVKEMFEMEQQQQQQTNGEKTTTGGGADGGTSGSGASATGGTTATASSQKSKIWKGRFVREERLVWQCANWLYDWTEAMTTLQEDIRKYRNKVQRKEQQQQTAQNQTTAAAAQQSESTTMDAATATTAIDGEEEKPGDPNWQEAKNWALCAFVSDLQNAVETGLSTVTGILSVPVTSDVSSGLVVDFLNGLTPFFKMCGGESTMDIDTADRKTEDSTTATDVPSKSSFDMMADSFASFASSHKFLRTLMENPSKVGRLPCFSYTHHSDLELSALYKQWPASQFVDRPPTNQQSQQPTSSSADMAVFLDEKSTMTNDDGDGVELKSCRKVVDEIGTLIEDVLHGRRDISYTDDHVLKLCNETADALCLSVLSIMIRIIESIYQKLRPQIEKSMREPSETMADQRIDASDGLDDDTSLDIRDRSGSMAAKTPSNPIGDRGGSTSSDASASAVVFELLSSAPCSHRFVSKLFDPSMMPKTFLSAARKEVKLLHSSLPPGIFVKTYEDRMDLFSCMIIGPQGTPYADGVFFFDVRLKDDYPTRPPHLFYKSFSKSLNPNLYEDGMVCLSLLGTWDGKETELWTSNSTLLQVFVSIQSLILVSEPYFNEPGFEKEKGSQSGATKSRDYNEAAVLRTLESLQRALHDPPEPFRNEIRQHITENSSRLFQLLEKYQEPHGNNADLSFPLFPVTQGFCLCIKRHAENLRRLSEKWIAASSISTSTA